MVSLVIHANGKIDHRAFMYDHLGTADGLSSQRVYSIEEDKYGGIWIAIKNGVARYNGRTLTNYTLGETDKRSDTGGMVIKLTKDSEDNILAYNNKGEIFKYSEYLDRFIPIALQFTKRINEIKKHDSGLILQNVVVDKENNLWAATSKGIFFVSIDGETIKRDFEKLNVNCSVIAGQHLITCTTSGVWLIDRNTGKPIRTLYNRNTESAFVDTQYHRLWLGTFNQGTVIIDMKTWKKIETRMESLLPHTPVRAIEILNDTTIMLGIDGNGVYVANRKGKDARLLWNDDETTDNVIHGNGIYDILRDKQDNIWVGSYTGGIDIAYPTGSVMTTFEHKQGVEQSLMNNGVNDVLEVGNNLYFATDGGISILNQTTKHWTHTLIGKVVLTLCDTDDGILAGTYGNGVFKLGTDNICRELYSTSNGMLDTDYIYSVHRDSRGNIWIGCLDGALVQVNGNRKHKYDIITVESISDAPDGKIAVCTATGFYIIDPISHTSTHYLGFEECMDKDINNYIRSILFNKNGTVWLATDGGGLYLYNLKSRKRHVLTTKNGLPSNSISALSFDEMGRIIIGTDAGLAILYPKTMEVININFIKMVNREYNRASMGNTQTGRIIFGSNSGAISIAPSLINKLDYDARLRFSNIIINSEKEIDDNKIVSLHKSLEEGKVRLDYADNTFCVSFESICYQYHNDINFQYKLEGFNDTWSPTSDNSTVQFTNLPAGRYRLKVKAVSRNNKRVLDEKYIEIIVAEPWWNSIWAWAVYVTTICVILYLTIKNYRGRLERKYFNEKIDFFVHAAHDIRTPLSLVLAPLSNIAEDEQLSEKSRKCLKIAMSNGDKLSNMISELLDFQKADVLNNTMKPVEVRVITVLEGIIDKFCMMANDKHITIEISDCPKDIIISLDYKLGTKLFDNLLSNAIKYTPDGGRITLRANTYKGKVKIDVKDNGMGIPKDDQKKIFNNYYRAENVVKTKINGTGLGLMLARRITSLHNGELTFRSEEGKGTTFTVSLPLVRREMEVTKTENKEEKALSSEIILFVDDNADLRSYFHMTFSANYKVVTVENGKKALEYLKDNECDIVVSDVMMPEMQGDELCRRIKGNHDTSWMPVILLTAKASKDFIIEGLETGADDYITKPFDTEILKSKIETTLANRRRMSEYYKHRVDNIVTEGKAAQQDINTTEANEDSDFIDKATAIVMENMGDTDFGIDNLCREMAMSRTLFYGRIKTLTAQTPQDFVRNIRLQRAAKLLHEGKQILDVCAICGFTNSKHFSTVFKKQFGVSPSKY